jgi:hypothetical protein
VFTSIFFVVITGVEKFKLKRFLKQVKISTNINKTSHVKVMDTKQTTTFVDGYQVLACDTHKRVVVLKLDPEPLLIIGSQTTIQI